MSSFNNSSINDWNTETLISFLSEQNLNLDHSDFNILRNQKIDGQVFPNISEKTFMDDGMKRGPAMKLANMAKMFKKNLENSHMGKIGYFWLLPCSSWSIQNFTSWSNNMFSFTENEKKLTNSVFYNALYIMRDDPNTSQEILDVVKRLLKSKNNVSMVMIIISLIC
jgi:hypothetical protein